MSGNVIPLPRTAAGRDIMRGMLPYFRRHGRVFGHTIGEIDWDRTATEGVLVPHRRRRPDRPQPARRSALK